MHPEANYKRGGSCSGGLEKFKIGVERHAKFLRSFTYFTKIIIITQKLSKEKIVMINKHKLNRLLFFTILFLFALMFSFAGAGSELIWTSINADKEDSFLRVIPIEEIKILDEISYLVNPEVRYENDHLFTVLLTRDEAIRSLTEVGRNIRMQQGNTEGIEQEIRWLQNNNNQIYIYAADYMLNAYPSKAVTTVVGNNVYIFEYQVWERYLLTHGNLTNTSIARSKRGTVDNRNNFGVQIRIGMAHILNEMREMEGQ